MMNNSSTPYQSFGSPEAVVTQQRVYMARVYGWMTVGLAFTALAAAYTLSQDYLIAALVRNSALWMGLVIVELGMVLVLSAAVNRLSPPIATALFLVYAALNGVTLSFVVLLYTSSSIAETFLITAGTFGLMSIYGYVTKRDLTSLGNLLFMLLLGMILASVVNIFLNVAAIYWITTYVGVAIFVGLVAYDTQRIKRMMTATVDGSEAQYKGAILGALALYLDFVNLFLLLLRIFGRRR
jgi:FtsH-binding integral membrane protein